MSREHYASALQKGELKMPSYNVTGNSPFYADDVTGSGNDTINGDSANNVIYGGYGTDTIYGRLGNDRLHGNSINDYIW